MDKKLTKDELYEVYREWAYTQDVEYDKAYFLKVFSEDDAFIKQFYSGSYDGEPVPPPPVLTESEIFHQKMQKFYDKITETHPIVREYKWTWKQDIKYIFYKIFQLVGYVFWGTLWLMYGNYFMWLTGEGVNALSFVHNMLDAQILGFIMIPFSLYMTLWVHPVVCDMWWTNEEPCIYEDTGDYKTNSKLETVKDTSIFGISVALISDLLSLHIF